jgi:hypothetical protein
MFERTKEKQMNVERTKRLVSSLGLTGVPKLTIKRLFRIATGLGWDEKSFYLREQVEIMQKAIKITRDRLVEEGISTGVNELERKTQLFDDMLNNKPNYTVMV